VALQIAGALGNRLGAVKGLTDLRSATQQGEPEYRIVIDRENAARFGLTVRDVAQHISAQVRGTEATYLGDFDRKITIRVQPTEEQRSSIEELLNSTVRTYAGSVPLRELAQVRTTEGYGEIWRNNQQRAAILLANVHGRSVSGVVGDVEEAAAGMSLPAGYTLSVGGENEEYESILYPLVIILTSPLAFIGAIFAMVLAGQHYNVISLVGIAIMVGAVDNEAVIAVDIITELRRDGVPLADAIRKGMRLRLRPILMTTATTVLGVIPLVLAIGTGSELVQALAIPLVGGLIASTLFSITTIPVVYTYIDRWAIGRTRSVADNAR
jgi:HAE1 family hydrophobic/amphiphilic exporter-1